MALAGVFAAIPAHAHPAAELGRFSCTARVSSGTFVCHPLLPAPGAALDVATAAPAAREHGEWTASMTLRNGMNLWLGTADGRTADASGVTVAVLGAPTTTEGLGTVRVRTDALGAAARYVGVLAPGGTSAAKAWTFDVPEGVEAFTVQVAVAGVATIPPVFATNNAPAAQGLSGTSETVAAAVRTATGLRLPSSVYTWSSSDTGVATVSSTGEVSRVGMGHATVTLSANGVPAAQYPVQVCPPLAVGEVLHIADAHASSFCVAGGTADAAEYTLLPSNLSTTAAQSLTVTGSGIQAVTGPPTPSAFRAEEGSELLSAAAEDASELAVSPVPDGFAGQRVQATARQQAVPNVGDVLNIQVAQGCTGTADVRASTVRAVSSHFIVVFDNSNPAFSPTYTGNPFDPDTLINRLERIVWPSITAGFGTPTDLDDNGRIVVVYTGYLNSLSPPASSTIVDGLFEWRDLYAKAGGCPLSNEGEYLYQMVPDPTGSINSNVRTESSVVGNSSRVGGDLTARLIAQSKRIYSTNDYQMEEGWLEQGLVSIAEELMFYAQSAGLAPRQNIITANLTTGPNASRRVAAFNTYANANYGRLRPFLQRPDTSGAFRSGTSMAARGATWAFLRYAIDRRVTEGGVTDASILSALAGGQPYVGKENLRHALGLASTDELDQWYRDFLVAMYTDDSGVAGVATRYTQPSWNFRSLFTALNGNYQLVPRALTNGTSFTLTYARGGGTAYLRFGVPQGGFASVTANSGGGTPAPMRFSIVRTK